MLETLNSPYIHSADSDSFRALVLDNSNKGPVLVNFWSKQAGPCLRQYPILDKLVHDYNGRFLLINVDTQKEFIFTKEYGITSVPTLKLFRNNEVVATLHGYQSEADLKKILDRYVARDSDRVLAAAIHEYAQGKGAAAYEMIAEAIVEDPDNVRLPLAMCKLLRHEQRYAEALKLLKSLPEKLHEVAGVKAMTEIIGFHLERNDKLDMEQLQQMIDAEPSNLELRRQYFIAHVLEQNYEMALQQLVEIMEIEQTFDRNYAQQAMLRVFTILSESHPLVREYRKNLRRYTY